MSNTSANAGTRSEEHTSELQSLMRISYAVFCLKKKNADTITHLSLNVTHHLALYFTISSNPDVSEPGYAGCITPSAARAWSKSNYDPKARICPEHTMLYGSRNSTLISCS